MTTEVSPPACGSVYHRSKWWILLKEPHCFCGLWTDSLSCVTFWCLKNGGLVTSACLQLLFILQFRMILNSHVYIEIVYIFSKVKPPHACWNKEDKDVCLKRDHADCCYFISFTWLYFGPYPGPLYLYTVLFLNQLVACSLYKYLCGCSLFCFVFCRLGFGANVCWSMSNWEMSRLGNVISKSCWCHILCHFCE